MRKLRLLAVLALTLALAGCASLRDWSEIFENLNRTLLPLTVLIKSSAAPATELEGVAGAPDAQRNLGSRRSRKAASPSSASAPKRASTTAASSSRSPAARS